MKLRNLLLILVAVFSFCFLAACDGEKGPNLEGVLSYSEYVAAEEGTEVTIAGYIQGKQSWWDNKATLYLQDDNGGYFVYELTCTEAQYNNDLKDGNLIKVTGIKGSWAGQVEILGQESGAEATWELVSGYTKTYEYKLVEDTTPANLLTYLNQKVELRDLEVVSVSLPTQEGGDIYYDVTDGTNTYTFCVEQYLTDASTAVYQKVLTLKAGDNIVVKGFMYCYNTAQLHTLECATAN